MKRFMLLVLFMFLFYSPAQAEGIPTGYIEIPSIALYRPIYFIPLVDRSYDLNELGFGLGVVGHLDQTNWIHDTWGRTVLVGHTPGAFETLTDVTIGDVIYVSDSKETAVYIVSGIYIVEITEVGWLAPTETPTLLLMTCYGEQRWLVEAYKRTD